MRTAVRQYEHAVGEPDDFFQSVADVDRRDAEALREIFQVGQNVGFAFEVESGEGLVEQEQLWAGQERPGEGDALALPSGERTDAPVQQRPKVEGGDDVAAVEAGSAGSAALVGKSEIAGHAEMPEEARVLEHEADRPAMRGDVHSGLAVEPDLASEGDAAGPRGIEAGDRPQERALAAAARSEKRGDAVEAQLFRDIEVESGKGKMDPEGQQLSRHARGTFD